MSRVNRKSKKPGLSEEQIEEIREAFNLFDTGNQKLPTSLTHNAPA
jgi:Ca2+-binding EF-hand superfamily protein